MNDVIEEGAVCGVNGCSTGPTRAAKAEAAIQMRARCTS